MITVSTYAEPAALSFVPVPSGASTSGINEISGTDPPQSTHQRSEDIEKTESPDSFANILAGLLRKNGAEELAPESSLQNADSKAAAETALVDFSENEAGYEIPAAEKSSSEYERLFGIHPEETAQIKEQTLKDTNEKELSEIEIPEEHLSILLSAEHLLARLEAPAPVEADVSVSDDFLSAGDLQQDFNGIEPADQMAAIEPDADFLPQDILSALSGTEETAVVTQAPVKEALPVETDRKQERTLSKTESVDAPSFAEGRKGEETAAVRSEPLREERGRLDETRRGGKNRDRITIEVRDQRTGTISDESKNPAMRLNANVETRARVEAPSAELTLELRLPNQGQSSGDQVWEAKAGQAIEDLLARELHQNFNGDIVRHASMALRDGGEGTIKLALKPESLGNVKIHLEMADNKITGHIVVESEEALRAFQKEVHSLERAFRDSGFTNAELNLSLTADNRDAQRQETEAGPVPPQVAALRYDASFEEAQPPLMDAAAWYRRGLNSINMLA